MSRSTNTGKDKTSFEEKSYSNYLKNLIYKSPREEVTSWNALVEYMILCNACKKVFSNFMDVFLIYHRGYHFTVISCCNMFLIVRSRVWGRVGKEETIINLVRLNSNVLMACCLPLPNCYISQQIHSRDCKSVKTMTWCCHVVYEHLPRWEFESKCICFMVLWAKVLLQCTCYAFYIYFKMSRGLDATNFQLYSSLQTFQTLSYSLQPIAAHKLCLF